MINTKHFKRPCDAALLALIERTPGGYAVAPTRPTEEDCDDVARSFNVDADMLSRRYRAEIRSDRLPYLSVEQRKVIAFLHAHGAEPYYRAHGLRVETAHYYSHVDYMRDAIDWLNGEMPVDESAASPQADQGEQGFKHLNDLELTLSYSRLRHLISAWSDDYGPLIPAPPGYVAKLERARKLCEDEFASRALPRPDSR
jgi:hypothetical protein